MLKALNEQGILSAVFCPLNRQTCFKSANFVSLRKKERLAKAVCHSPQHVLCDPLNLSAVYLMNFFLERSVKQQAVIIFLKSTLDSWNLVTSSWNLESCDLILESCESWESSCENWDARYCQLTFECSITCWHNALVLMCRYVQTKCIKNKNILQFCSQVRPNTKIQRLGFSEKLDKQP